MNILIVAATDREISTTRELIGSESKSPLSHSYSFLTTGIGITRSTFELTHYLGTHSVDLVIQIGVAGSYHSKITIGEVVWVVKDCFPDLGADTDDGFLSLTDIHLASEEFFVESDVSDIPKLSVLSALKKVTGATSDIIHHREERISEIKNRFQPDVETMEGASMMYVCEQLNVPCLHLRAISNDVTKRENNNWNLEKSLFSLNECLKELFLQLENQPL